MSRWLALSCAMLAACVGHVGELPGSPDDPPTTMLPPSMPPPSMPPPEMPPPPTPTASLCNRGHRDVVSQRMCASPAPVLKSLAELQALLGLAFTDTTALGMNGVEGNPGFVLTGHSTSLVGRQVSALNPRALVFTPSPVRAANPGFVAMGFVRGEQAVEVIAHDPAANTLRFYLFRFAQACNDNGGCTSGDLYTSAIERGWTKVEVLGAEDMANTSLDCAQCHQVNGKSVLRWQETVSPWTHFFKNDTEGGMALLADFHAAHGTSEDYGPIPAALIDKSDPRQLDALVTNNGFAAQPNPFSSPDIEREVRTSSAAQPRSNVPAGVSPTWQALYDRSVTGQAIAVPYHDVKVTDPDKLSVMTSAYQRFLSGSLPKDQVPDLSQVLLERGLRNMGFRPKEGLGGRALLVQVCQRCHSAAVDSALSKARFRVDALEAMSRAEKNEAIRRLQLPPDAAAHMPPSRFIDLDASEIQRLVDELSQ